MRLHQVVMLLVYSLVCAPGVPEEGVWQTSRMCYTERPRNVKFTRVIKDSTALQGLLPMIATRALMGEKISENVMVFSPNDRVPPTLYLRFEGSHQYEAYTFTGLSSVYEASERYPDPMQLAAQH